MKPTALFENNRFLPAIIKKNGKTKILPGAFYGEPAALAAAQRKIDRLKDAKLKKKANKKRPPVFVTKNAVDGRYIVYVYAETEYTFYALDSSGEWVESSKSIKRLSVPSYQEAYQAGLDYLKSL